MKKVTKLISTYCRKIRYNLQYLNFKTVYFNFKYLPLKQAVKLPIWVSNKVFLLKTSGQIQFNCPIKAGLVRIGGGEVGIFDMKKSRSMWQVSGTVVFNGATCIGHGSKISIGDTGILEFGKNFNITAESSIVTFCHVKFGDRCLLSWDILVMDTDLHKIKDGTAKVTNVPSPIIIGNDVWIGCRCLILKGAKIPNGCVIGANSVVNKALDGEKSIFAGNPIRCIRENVTWET
jgi:acetyltransferase-like isoleucine patch superfamily enzyme